MSKIESKMKRTFKISLEEKPDFKGEISAFLFDSAGNLLETVSVKEGKASFSSTEDELAHGRLFFAPVLEQAAEMEKKPTINMMERIGAYEPVIRHKAKLIDAIRIPGGIIDFWPICFCRIKGHVIKADSGLPICGARVHICEVDRVWRYILKLPDPKVIQFRDELLKIFNKPLARVNQEISPSPFTAMRKGLINLVESPVAPLDSVVELERDNAGPVIELPANSRAALNSSSPLIVRQALLDNVKLIIPYLCLLPPWLWRYRCDEVSVVESDSLGRFEAIVYYACKGDKPDLYFWVEYNLGGIWETVYRPTIRCHTYWNYSCGSDVIIRVSDERVSACNNGPDPDGCVVQILSIGPNISMNEIQGPGVAPAIEGLSYDDRLRPFGGKLEPRVWFSRTTLRDVKHITYYRWSYRRLTEGDGTLLTTPGPWANLSRVVVRHYAVPVPGGVAHVPATLGPQPHLIGSEANLFEIRPRDVPAGGIEWTVVDEREDLASAHFETNKLGDGTDACSKAFNSAGKYELKLELFKNNGALVDWDAEGINLQIADVEAPFGTDPVTFVSASDYYRIRVAGQTMAFRMVVRIDNNCCQADVEPIQGTGLNVTPCGFMEYTPGARVNLRFRAYHPNNFADFDFSVKRGVSDDVLEASAAGQTGSISLLTKAPFHPPLSPRAYALATPSTGEYQEDFSVGELLGPCTRAAFSEALHVWTRATDGYGRLWYLDAFDHAGFALTPSP